MEDQIYAEGSLALVQTGDIIEVDVDARRLNLRVPQNVLVRRRAAWSPEPTRFERGYGWMFSKHIQQVHGGCDFDFLRTDFGARVREPNIY